MFDTIGMKYKTRERAFWNSLENLKEVTDINTGLILKNGKLRNMRISEKIDCIIINGSLSKFHLGNNLESLTRKTTKEAIENLSDRLKLKIDNSVLYRFDVSQNMIMRGGVQNYFSCLGDLKGFIKSNYGKSIYYRTNQIELIFYDKIAEMKKKRQEIPESFREYSGRVLRYELRYLRNLKKTFSKEIHLKDLTEENFYISLIKKWKEYYFRIEKILQIKLNNEAMANRKLFQKQLMILGLKALGYEQAKKMIEMAGQELSYTQKSRARNLIKGLIQEKELTEINPNIQELDEKVKQSALHYR